MSRIEFMRVILSAAKQGNAEGVSARPLPPTPFPNWGRGLFMRADSRRMSAVSTKAIGGTQ